MMYARTYLLTVSSSAPCGSSLNVSSNHVHFIVNLSMQFAGGNTPSSSSNHTHGGRPPAIYRGKSVRHPLTY
ncbi:uncharacterized protein DS421_20g705620 [Arachis hypogaea]|nr:uncharacterized protein DS421_20g705620 [Arachis hypogaea]